MYATLHLGGISAAFPKKNWYLLWYLWHRILLFPWKKASTKLLSRQGYLHASACCLRSRENEEMEIFVKSGQNQKLIFFISIYLDSVVSLISIHLQKFETNQEFCILFFTQLYSCFFLFSPLKACNSSACGGRRWSLEIKNRIMGWNLKVYA